MGKEKQYLERTEYAMQMLEGFDFSGCEFHVLPFAASCKLVVFS